MALSEKYRSRFYEHFVEHVGEEAAEAMMAQFPSRDADEPATKELVLRTAAELRTEIAQQTDRLMTRMQVAVGMGFGFVAIVSVLTR